MMYAGRDMIGIVSCNIINTMIANNSATLYTGREHNNERICKCIGDA